MKSKINLIFTLLITLLSHKGFAWSNNPVISEVISTEYIDFTGTFEFQIKYKFLDTVTFSGNVNIELPDGWTATINPALANNTFFKNDSAFITINVSYPMNNIPYFVQNIRFSHYLDSSYSNIEIFQSAMIYFTPYNTIEIWNLSDFTNLTRRWLMPDEVNDTTRFYINKNNIPLSNINTISPINWDDSTRVWDDDWLDEFREIYIPGLAYNVLMTPIPRDSLDFYNNYGDGLDSLSVDTLFEKGLCVGKWFKGSVSGYITATFHNDLGVTVPSMPIAGIKIKLRERDYYMNTNVWQNFGETYTDENGYYTITYEECQINEGDYVELQIQVISSTSDEFQIIGSNFWGNRFTYSFPEFSTPQTAYGQTKSIVFSEVFYPSEAFKTVHWARRGFQYFKNQNIQPFDKKLRIRPYANNSWFDIWASAQKPAIHIGSGYGRREGTTYHEFGHVVMYKLQNNTFTIPFGEQGVSPHYWAHENTSRLAWVEGWANAIEMILDAVYWEEDDEYGDVTKIPYENRFHYSWGNEEFPDVWWYIQNGFRSEYYIACAIYDLWDGANRNLPNVLPGTNQHGWNDTGQGIRGWESVDDVELSFLEICKPLTDNNLDYLPLSEGGYFSREKCFNIQDYIFYLLENHNNNCKTKSDISRVFRENRVLMNIPEYEWNWNITNISSDKIRQSELKLESGYAILIGFFNSQIWIDNYIVNYNNKNAINNNQYLAYEYVAGHPLPDDFKITDSYWLGVWDTYSNAYRRSDLSFNNEIIPLGNLHHATYTTCGNTEMDVRYGRVTIGGGGATANIEITDGSILRFRGYGNINNLLINSGSELRIKTGGTLFIQSGSSVQLMSNSKIIVESGGYICIEDNVNLLLDGNSIIHLQTGAINGLNPALNLNVPLSYCTNLNEIDYTGSGTVIIDNCSDFATYTDFNDVIISGSITWNNEQRKLKENLIVESYGVFNIDNLSKIEFAKDKKIIIKEGGKLIVNNSTITNLSECNELWLGIEVWGTTSASQATQGAQGRVELKNGAVIENSLQAIRTIATDGNNNLDWSKTGGIVKANNAVFRNNKNGVWIGGYENTQPSTGNPINNVSYITNCSFEINDNYIDGIHKPYEFIGLCDVSGIRILGNTFVNTHSGFSGQFRGRGIVSYDASYTVGPLCVAPTIIPCPQYQPNTFEGLYYGIHAQNTNPAKTVSIKNNVFNDNFRAVALKNINHAEVVLNEFLVGASVPFDMTKGGQGQTIPLFSYSYGLSLENCTGYRVEENDFGSNHSNAGFGVIVQNSGTAPNHIYNNSFEELKFAVRAQGLNGGSFASLKSGGTSMPVYLSSGLVIKCNDFSNINVADISVTSGSIAPNQNKCSDDTKTPANNLFSDACINNFNHIWTNLNVAAFKYSVNHEPVDELTNPICTYGNVVIIPCDIVNSQYDETESCPSYLLPASPAVLKPQILSKSMYAQTLAAQFDGGNTQVLLDDIYQNKPAGELKNTLIAASPYLSDTVLLATVMHKPSPLPPGILKEILVPNSPLSPNVMQAVEGRTPSLPGGIMNKINSVQHGVSQRELLEKELAYIEGEIAMLEKILIQTWLSDTTYNGRDSVIAWFENKPQTTETQQFLIEAYLANAQLTEAMQMLSQINQATASDSAFVIYYTILTDLYSAGENIFSLSPTHEQTMRQIAESQTTVSGNAQTVLWLVYGDEYELIIEELLLPDSMSIYGYLSSGAFCDYMPVAGDTLFLVDENMEPVAGMPYTVTNDDGYFIFNTHHFIFADTTKLYGISTKNAYQTDDVLFAPLHQLISTSPHELIHGDVRLEWFDLYAGPDSIYAIGTKIDLNGNIYVGGRTWQLNPLGNNVFLVKYSPQGERLWETVYNAGVTHLHEYLFDLETDSNGNSYMLFYSATTNDILLKFDDKGQLIWTAAVENIPNKKFRGINIEFDIYGNIIVAGHLDDYSQQTAKTDFFAAKFNENGQKIWFQLFDMSQNDNLMSMTTDKDGNIILSGSYYANSIRNGIVICYDNNGTLLWSNTYITGGSDIATVVKTDLAGNVYVAGNTDYINGFLLKYSPNGNLLWADNMFSDLIPRALIIDSENMLYVGMEKWELIYDVSHSILKYISYSARKYNENGNVLWQSTYENPDLYAARFNSVTIDNNNYLYASGYAMPDDSTENSVAVTVKMDFDGNFVRTDIFSVPNGIKHQGNNLVVSENNNIYVAGQCYDAESIKMFTVKYSQCHSQSGLRSDQWYPEEEDQHEADVLPVLSGNSIQVYPNPYSGQTTIDLSFEDASAVKAEVYTITGQRVCTLHEGNLQPGTHSFSFRAHSHGFSSGVYVLKVIINNESMHRMLIEME